MTFDDFKKLYADVRLTTDNGEGTTRSAAEWWLGHRNRRTYREGVIFDPTKAARPGHWNLWRGWAINPAPGEWARMESHIRTVICQENETHYRYLMGWLARMFQKPNKQAEVAVVLRGKKGCGKGTLGNLLERACGQHGIHIANSKHLVGNFNAHLRDAIFLFADEAFFAGDKQHEGVLKALITEPSMFIEGKYQNGTMVPNMLHIMMASNSEWVIPATDDERRFFVLDVSGAKVKDRAYFAALYAEMDAGGIAAMIYDLLKWDISGFDHRDVPETNGLQEQKLHSLDTLHRWWLEVLRRGFVWRSPHGLSEFTTWLDWMATSFLMRSYQQWCRDNQIVHRSSVEQLGRMLSKFYKPKKPSGKHPIDEPDHPSTVSSNLVMYGERPPGYEFGKLDEARSRFEHGMKIEMNWE